MTGMLLKKLIVLFFLGTVFGAGISTLFDLETTSDSKKSSTEDFNGHALMSGELARNFESRYDDDFSLRQFGLNVWAAFQYSIFKEAQNGLLIGHQGWLFTSEEFIANPGGDEALAANINFITEASRLLASKNVALIVVLIPSKARLLSGQTGRHQPSLVQQKTYPQVLNHLQEESVLTVDGLQEMGSHTQPDSLYLRTDTHWTPRAARLIAFSTAALLQREIPDINLRPQAFITERSGSNTIEGDLLSFLPLAPLFENLMPATETIEQFQTYPVGDDPFDQAVFDDSVLIIEEALFSPIEPSEVILLGTSFSADRRWNFEGALKQALEVDVQNIAVQGQGPITPMANFLSDDSALSTDLKLVIWEIPERYLTVAYPQTSF